MTTEQERAEFVSASAIKPGDHNYEYELTRPEELDYVEKLFGTALRLEFHNHPTLIVGCIDNQLVAWVDGNEPHSMSFGGYVQDLLNYAQVPKKSPGAEDLKAKPTLVYYNEATRRFEPSTT